MRRRRSRKGIFELGAQPGGGEEVLWEGVVGVWQAGGSGLMGESWSEGGHVRWSSTVEVVLVMLMPLEVDEIAMLGRERC